MADTEKESIAKMAGGFFREFGVLYLTFGLLDGQMADTEHPGRFGIGWFVQMALISVGFMALGVVIERVRRR